MCDFDEELSCANDFILQSLIAKYFVDIVQICNRIFFNIKVKRTSMQCSMKGILLKGSYLAHFPSN